MKRLRIKIVGAGLAGCSCANILADCPMVERIDIYEKHDIIGGLCFDNGEFGLYQYCGPHIFHTSNPKVINYVLKFAEFKPFTNRPIACTDSGLARLPISIETVKDLKKQSLDDETILDKQCIFDNVIKDYSFKQWGKPADKKVLDRLKVYEGLSGSYFNDLFEGIPKAGFTKMMLKMLDSFKINVINEEADSNKGDYELVIWTGPIDEIKGFNEKIEWRGTKFVYHNYDFLAPRLAPVYNMCSEHFQSTRSTDIDQLTGGNSGMILEEFPGGDDKHYPIVENREKVDRWIGEKEAEGLYCCGRLGTASYFDMDDTIENAFEVCERIVRKAIK